MNPEKQTAPIPPICQRYNAIVQALNSLGFDLEITPANYPNEIIARFPDSSRVAFQGDIEAAEKWLFNYDLEFDHPVEHFFQLQKAELESYQRTRRASFLATLACVVFGLSFLFESKPFAFWVGIPGVLLLAFAFRDFFKLNRLQRHLSRNKN